MPDESHDPARRSWIESANAPGCPFPIQNLPFGVFSRAGEAPRPGVAIGDEILDLAALERAGLLALDGAPVFAAPALDALMRRPRADWLAVRARLSGLLSAGEPALRDAHARDAMCVDRATARLHMPFTVAGFTDFYASREHATNVGTLFRGPEKALPPNWLHIPIGYNGRASSVVVSGTPVRRPLGQLKGAEDPAPRLGPCEKLDFELELGAIIGTASPMGQPITTAAAREAIFGYVLLNDWSARDIQMWEYQPLGPFQSKAFATSISPWIVTAAALEPFRVPGPEPALPLLPYLREDGSGNLDIELEVSLTPQGGAESVICRSNARGLYYSAAQQLAHHALGGCPMSSGDLLGSGTISGAGRGSEGSMLEFTRNGAEPLRLADGTERRFLADGDRVALTGWCTGQGYRIGFGTCEGTVLPAAAPVW
ncbi:MAG: fumarylacetoacetase [Pseudomonadota bacterium]